MERSNTSPRFSPTFTILHRLIHVRLFYFFFRLAIKNFRTQAARKSRQINFCATNDNNKTPDRLTEMRGERDFGSVFFCLREKLSGEISSEKGEGKYFMMWRRSFGFTQVQKTSSPFAELELEMRNVEPTKNS